MTVKKANQQLMFLRCNLRKCPSKLKANSYQVYVKPILSYASSVWNPIGTAGQGLRTQLEMVQRKAARFFNSDWSWESSPRQMMSDLNWRSLELVRKINNIVLLYRMVHGMIGNPPTFLPKRSRDGTKFQPVYGRVNTYRGSFVPSTVLRWNETPKELLKSGNINVFRKKILKFLSS